MLKKIKGLAVSVLPVALALPGVSHAAVDTAVTTAIDGTLTDASTVGSAMLVVVAGLLVFAFVRKVMH